MDQNNAGVRPCPEILHNMVRCLRRTLNMSLIGVDVIVENETGIHYIIDINAFPGKACRKFKENPIRP